MGEDLEPAVNAVAPPGIYGNYHALAPELSGQLSHQLRPVHGCRVDRHLVGSSSQNNSSVLDRTDAAPHGERDEHLLGRSPDHVNRGVPEVGGSSDIKEHQFVGTLQVVPGGQLNWVTCVAHANEVDALDHPASIHVEARNYPDGLHQRSLRV